MHMQNIMTFVCVMIDYTRFSHLYNGIVLGILESGNFTLYKVYLFKKIINLFYIIFGLRFCACCFILSYLHTMLWDPYLIDLIFGGKMQANTNNRWK